MKTSKNPMILSVLEMLQKGIPVKNIADFHSCSTQYIYSINATYNPIKRKRTLPPKSEHCYLRNSLKFRARTLVSAAIRKGILVPEPCEVCGEIKNAITGKRASAHHDDYSKPLEIRWLCEKHHILWHKTNKAK